MCQFEYWFFESCSHRVIDIVQFCRPRLWEAGRNRIIQPCLETKYKTSQFRYGVEVWHGKSGTCCYCIEQHAANNLERLSPGEPTGKRVPMCTSAADNETPPGLQKKDSMSPYPSEVPFVFRRRLEATLPELLGFRSQLDDKTTALFENIEFPGEIMVYTPQTNKSWTGKAIGTRPAGEWYFALNGGLLLEDRKLIEMRKRWKDPKVIWSESYQPRGMLWGDFVHFTDKKEVTFPLGTEVGDFYAKFLKLHMESLQNKRGDTMEASANVEGVGAMYEMAGMLGQSSDWHSDSSLDNPGNSQNNLGTQEGPQFGSPSGDLDNLTRGGPPPVPTFSSEGLANPSNTFIPSFGNGGSTLAQAFPTMGMGQPYAPDATYISGQTGYSNMSNTPLIVPNDYQVPPTVYPSTAGQEGGVNQGASTPQAILDLLAHIDKRNSVQTQMATHQAVHGPNNSAPGAFNNLNQGGINFGDQGQLPNISRSVSSSLQNPMSQAVYGPDMSASGVFDGLNQGGVNFGDQGQLPTISGSVSSSLQMPTPEEVYGPSISASGVYNCLNQGGMKVGDRGEPTATNGSVSGSLQMPTPQAVFSPNISTSGVLNKLNQDGMNVGDQGQPPAISASVPLQNPTPEAMYSPSSSTSEVVNSLVHHAHKVGNHELLAAIRGGGSSLPQMPTSQAYSDPNVTPAGQLNGSHEGGVDVGDQGMPPAFSGQFPSSAPHLGRIEDLLAAPIGTFGQDGASTGTQDVSSINVGGASGQFPQYTPHPGGMEALLVGPMGAFDQDGSQDGPNAGNQDVFSINVGGASGQFPQYTPHPGGMEALLVGPMGAFDQDGSQDGPNAGNQDVFSINVGGASGQFPQYTPHPGGMEALLVGPMGAFDQDGSQDGPNAGNQDVFSNNGGGVPGQFPQYNTDPGQLANIQAGQFSLSQNVTLANNFNQQNSNNLDEDPFGFDQGMDLSFGFGDQDNSLGGQMDGTLQDGSGFQQSIETQQTLAGRFGTPSGPGQQLNMSSYPQDDNLGGSNDFGQSIFPPPDNTAKLFESPRQDPDVRRKYDIPGYDNESNEEYSARHKLHMAEMTANERRELIMRNAIGTLNSGRVDPRLLTNKDSVG